MKRSEIQRKAPKRRSPRSTGPSAEVRDACLERDSYSCVLCGKGVGPDDRGEGWSLHHRLRRSQGGKHVVENLIVLCGHGASLCHGSVHASPDAGRAGGWLLDRGQDPLKVPILIAGEYERYLTADGRYAS